MHSPKQCCWMGFLSICLTGVLLLNQVVQSRYDDFEDATPSPDYIDYNSTFEYSFYSNASTDELDKFLGVDEDFELGEDEEVYDEEVTPGPVTFGPEVNSDPEVTSEPEVTFGPEVNDTPVTITTTTEREEVQFSKAASLPVTWVHWSLLLASLQLVNTL